MSPVEVGAIVNVPDPLASNVSGSLVADEVVVIASPPPDAADLILIPVTDDAVAASIVSAGLVAPLAPAVSAVAEVEETVNPVNVPIDVNDDAVTPEFNVAPVNVPAAAVTVISAEPLNETPLMFLGVVSVAADVAVAALPPIESPDAVPVKLVATPDDGVPKAPPETRMFEPSIDTTPAETLASVVSVA
jgi:hypothetical protein